ncbi:hypothetical protein [Caulobacter sp.]|jgi:hypothetical protein|uniref:hypothetical protein n=1 Tax=Caulobacter sp. TaxID=78 RepID=UPI0031DCE6E6
MKSWILLVGLAAATPALAQADPPPAPVPASVRALEGCWTGTGHVMGKAVTLDLSAKPITEGTMFLVEAQSHAVADPKDRYAAHLVFGGKGGAPMAVSGFWIDSFGGDFTATGAGAATADGFDIAYAYPDASFVNRWRRAGETLSWTIVAKTAKAENAFARYDLKRTACRPA